MASEGEYRSSEGGNNLFPSKNSNIRISPAKRETQTTRKSMKPFSSSIIP
jgi:hypothetical protein